MYYWPAYVIWGEKNYKFQIGSSNCFSPGARICRRMASNPRRGRSLRPRCSTSSRWRTRRFPDSEASPGKVLERRCRCRCRTTRTSSASSAATTERPPEASLYKGAPTANERPTAAGRTWFIRLTKLGPFSRRVKLGSFLPEPTLPYSVPRPRLGSCP